MKLLTFFVLLIIISSSAHASLVLEPYVSANFIASKNFGTFLGYGGKTGLSVDRVAFGLDYTLADFEDKIVSVSGTNTNKFSRTKMGLYMSLALSGDGAPSFGKSSLFPTSAFQKKIWVTYIFNVKDKIISSGGIFNNGDLFKGRGFEIGTSRKLYSIFSYYLALRRMTLDQLEDVAGNTTTLGGSNIQKINEIEIGLSLPFTMF